MDFVFQVLFSIICLVKFLPFQESKASDLGCLEGARDQERLQYEQFDTTDLRLGQTRPVSVG